MKKSSKTLDKPLSEGLICKLARESIAPAVPFGIRKWAWRGDRFLFAAESVPMCKGYLLRPQHFSQGKEFAPCSTLSYGSSVLPPPVDKSSLKQKKRVRLELEVLEKRLTPGAGTLVNTNADDPMFPIPGVTTLRDAIGNVKAGGAITFTSKANSIQLQKALPALSVDMSINGGVNGVTVFGPGNGAQNPFNVFWVKGGADVGIDSLSILNGYLKGQSGGGIYNSGALTLNNDTIGNNNVSGTGANGGGIFNKGTLILRSTTLDNNTSAQGKGGGIYNSGGGTVNISSSSYIEHSRATSGGAIFNGQGSTLNVKSGTTIDYNSVGGGGGGGGIDNSRGKATLSGVTMYENFAGAGGGIFIVGGTLKIKADCFILGNGATGVPGGGGMFMNGGTASISGGTFQGNVANNGNGGGIYVLSGTLSLSGGVSFNNNSAINGGGLYLGYASTTSFQGCTVSGNKATGKGAGVAYSSGAKWNGGPPLAPVGLTDEDDPGGNPVLV